MKIKYPKLAGAITEVCGTQKCFAQKMELSERSLSLKMTGKLQWKQAEMEKACTVLGRPKESIVEFFYS